MTCANCREALTGPFCANCGQAARDLQRPFVMLLADLVGDVFSLDTRLARTLRPLLFRPGHIAKEYLAGRRVAHVPPLRAYLIAALVFFGLFSVFPTKSPPVYVVTSGSAEAQALEQKSARGSRVTIELPQHVWFGDRRFQEASVRARANPEAFALRSYRYVQGAFFLCLPIFAVVLELFYRKRYYIDHLVFALYYHAFVFLTFAMLFLLGRSTLLPDLLVRPMRWATVLWLIAYLPLALRTVYGGSWIKTVLKVIGLGVLYLFGFVAFGFTFILVMAVITF